MKTVDLLNFSCFTATKQVTYMLAYFLSVSMIP